MARAGEAVVVLLGAPAPQGPLPRIWIGQDEPLLRVAAKAVKAAPRPSLLAFTAALAGALGQAIDVGEVAQTIDTILGGGG
ncbi:MAG: hypothetical protein H6710_12305 [Myxococcales bacterium]|nr:hypothetical protein [Myxococcales bacterium]